MHVSWERKTLLPPASLSSLKQTLLWTVTLFCCLVDVITVLCLWSLYCSLELLEEDVLYELLKSWFSLLQVRPLNTEGSLNLLGLETVRLIYFKNKMAGKWRGGVFHHESFCLERAFWERAMLMDSTVVVMIQLSDRQVVWSFFFPPKCALKICKSLGIREWWVFLPDLVLNAKMTSTYAFIV